jgi:peptide deformylase
MPRTLDIAQLGADIIRSVALPVTEIASSRTQTFIDDLFATCRAARGMGIAAPQVYEGRRIFIMSSQPNERYPYAPSMEPTAVINPEIIRYAEAMEKDWEGCLSLPGIRALVPRATSVEVAYTTRDGSRVSTRFEGFLARVFQHEYDHLEGTVFIDRVESTADIVMEQEFRRLIAAAARK